MKGTRSFAVRRALVCAVVASQLLACNRQGYCIVVPQKDVPPGPSCEVGVTSLECDSMKGHFQHNTVTFAPGDAIQGVAECKLAGFTSLYRAPTERRSIDELVAAGVSLTFYRPRAAPSR